MSKIVDLGNGLAMLKGYSSSYANLHFRLAPRKIRRLYCKGLLTQDEYYFWMDYLGYSPQQIKWMYSLDSLPLIPFLKEGE